MNEDEKDQKGDSPSMQVKDRRRFDSQGNERDETTESISKEQGKSAPPSDSKVSKSTHSDEFIMSEPSIDDDAVSFSSFIMSLATQSLVQLGEMQPPQGMEIPIDREAAQQSIDLLSMLRKKTKGNLSEAEDKLYEDILHSLRISYVKSANKK